MKKQIIVEELFRNDESEMELKSLELTINWIKINNPNHFNIHMIPEADYDGYIAGIVFVGDRHETDSELKTRIEVAEKIFKAFGTPEAKEERRKMGENI